MRLGVVFVLAAVLLASCQTTGAATDKPAVAPNAALAAHRVAFKSGDGVLLSAYFYRAAGFHRAAGLYRTDSSDRSDGVKPGPAIIMMHGCSGLLSKRGNLKKRETAWRDILLGEGYHVLLVDSFNPRGVRTICRMKSRPVLPDRDRPYDAYGGLAWLQAQSDVDPNKVALMGWSNGAMAMLWSIREDARQRPPTLDADFVSAVGFYPGCIKVGRTAFNRTAFKSSIPALLQVGLADRWTLPKPCIALVGASNDRGGARMEIDAYAASAHGFDHPDSRLREITTRNSVYKIR